MSKPYYTDEELEKNYTFCLYTAMMDGDLRLIQYYQILLDLLRNKKPTEKEDLVSFLSGDKTTDVPEQESKGTVTEAKKEEEEKKLSKGIIRWYPCRQCGEMIKETSAICPKCGSPFDVSLAKELENREIDITVELEPIPYAPHITEKISIKPLTAPNKIIKRLIEQGIIHNGTYEEVGIKRKEDTTIIQSDIRDDREWKKYPDYKAGDIVFFRRDVTLDEMIKAHLTYIEENYSDEQLFIQHEITVVVKNCLNKDKTKQVSICGCAGKPGIIKALGYHEAWFDNYPQVMIPFESGEIQVDAIVCDLGNSPIIMSGFKHTIPRL